MTARTTPSFPQGKLVIGPEEPVPMLPTGFDPIKALSCCPACCNSSPQGTHGVFFVKNGDKSGIIGELVIMIIT